MLMISTLFMLAIDYYLTIVISFNTYVWSKGLSSKCSFENLRRKCYCPNPNLLLIYYLWLGHPSSIRLLLPFFKSYWKLNWIIILYCVVHSIYFNKTLPPQKGSSFIHSLTSFMHGHNDFGCFLFLFAYLFHNIWYPSQMCQRNKWEIVRETSTLTHT